MKKFLLISLLFLGLILTGCTQKMDQDDLFEKKQECVNMVDIINKRYIGEREGSYIDQLFYSSVLDSCIVGIYYSSNGGGDTEGFYKITDALNGNLIGEYEVLINVIEGSREDNINKKNAYDQKIQELRGE